MIPPGAFSDAEASLAGTMYEAPALEHNLDPVLLYSVALAESARGADSQLQPWPYTLRVLTEAGFYGQSREEATQQLQRYLQKHGSVDIGIMQVNTRWHGHRVDDVTQLLDPSVGLRVGAEILRESIDSAPGDLVLGVGRYHNWADEERARNYGRRILAIYRNIRRVVRVAE
ncbi:transglycosylase [Halomonas sp. LBP4]|nr:transglycosylase [Halomonas sp. LBP4]